MASAVPRKRTARLARRGSDFDSAPEKPPVTRMASAASSGDHSASDDAPSSPTDLAGIQAYVRSSPLWTQLRLDDASLTDTVVAHWGQVSTTLCKHLGLASDALTPDESDRVYRYYLPTYLWCVGRIDAHRTRELRENKNKTPTALVVGLSAPQGCGKTTLATALAFCLTQNEFNVANVSLDDVYLTGQEQDALAATNPNNELLRFRGNAGTHDVGLAVAVLKKLRGGHSGGESSVNKNIPLPRYDKTLRNGRGDRAPVDDWPLVETPVDVVLFEGWMLGFEPVSDDEVCGKIHRDLKSVNEKLRGGGYDEMHGLIDDWLVIKVGDFSWVTKWRLEQEQFARAAGKNTLSDKQVVDFVRRFIPAYALYGKRMYASLPRRGPWVRTGREGEHAQGVFVVQVDETRRVVGGSDKQEDEYR